MKNTNTNVPEFISACDAGILEQKLGRIISDVAAGVIDHDSAGKVIITMDLTRIAASYQIEVKHKLTFKIPTAKGDITENNTTASAFYVGAGGMLTQYPQGHNLDGQEYLKDKETNETVTGEE